MVDLEARRTRVMGTDVAPILGVSRFKTRTPLRIYLEKIGEAPPTEETEPMWWGSQQEPLIAMRYEMVTGHTIEACEDMICHSTEDWAGGNLDGRVDAERIVEFKNVGRWASLADWGDPGTDLVPFDALCQTLWYLWVADADVCDVAALIHGSELRIYHVEKAANTWLLEEIVSRCRSFWVDHVVARKPPDPSVPEEVVLRWPRASDDMRQANHEDLAKIRAYLEARDNLKAAQAVKDRAAWALQEAIGPSSGLDAEGFRTTWLNQETGRLDVRRLKQELPDVYEKFRSTSETRVLRVREVTA